MKIIKWNWCSSVSTLCMNLPLALLFMFYAYVSQELRFFHYMLPEFARGSYSNLLVLVLPCLRCAFGAFLARVSSPVDVDIRWCDNDATHVIPVCLGRARVVDDGTCITTTSATPGTQISVTWPSGFFSALSRFVLVLDCREEDEDRMFFATELRDPSHGSLSSTTLCRLSPVLTHVTLDLCFFFLHHSSTVSHCCIMDCLESCKDDKVAACFHLQ
jgi:hypothetical protein